MEEERNRELPGRKTGWRRLVWALTPDGRKSQEDSEGTTESIAKAPHTIEEEWEMSAYDALKAPLEVSTIDFQEESAHVNIELDESNDEDGDNSVTITGSNTTEREREKEH